MTRREEPAADRLLEAAMECITCNICTERYDTSYRLPKGLPCGHTACWSCAEQMVSRKCPWCSENFQCPPEDLRTNFAFLPFLEVFDKAPGGGWCSQCRATAGPQCSADGHPVLGAKAALGQQLPEGTLLRAAVQLGDLQHQCQDEEALKAVALLTVETWHLTLQGGGRALTGTLENNGDPLIKALLLVAAARAALSEQGQAPPPRRPPRVEQASHSTPATLNLPPAGASAAESVALREIDAGEITSDAQTSAVFGDKPPKVERDRILQNVRGVDQLVHVWCHTDPAWSLKLLECAAPTVKQLSLRCPGEAHLRAVLAMPRLRRLKVSGDHMDLDAQPPALPRASRGLQSLRAIDLSRANLQRLLRAYGDQLDELWLHVGAGGQCKWPWSCSDLDTLLERCGLRLRRLVLRRWGYNHDNCNHQRDAVRRVLGGTEVLCWECDDVEEDDL